MRNIEELDINDRMVLEAIFKKEKAALTKYDELVLLARKDYVSPDDWERLMGTEDVIVDKPTKTEEMPVKVKAVKRK